jgi:hypothetical protein
MFNSTMFSRGNIRHRFFFRTNTSVIPNILLESGQQMLIVP